MPKRKSPAQPKPDQLREAYTMVVDVFEYLYPMLDEHERNTSEAKRAKAIADEVRAAIEKAKP